MSAKRSIFNHGRDKQRGAVLMVMLVIMIIGAVTIFVMSLNSSALQLERDKVTADALAKAKEALIGYAVKVQIDNLPCLAAGNNCARPGDLPCPDTNNDGVAGTSCGSADGSTGQTSRLGRLPWKTLGLPDLRDGSGERLWYAVSNNFKNNFRAALLNSDTPGTITVRAANGSILQDGSTASGAVAIIIAPGAVLTRQGGTLQDRSGPDNGTAKNTASNYLDIVVGIEDNAAFTDSTIDGFIQGSIKDASNNIILNDQLLVITQDNIMQAIQKRVAGEVNQCLVAYAADPQDSGRYPWTTKLDPTQPVSYSDKSNQLFGRVPDTPFIDTCEDSGGTGCSAAPVGGMKTNWAGNCNINSSSGWWLNWKEMVFYGLASSYKPINPPSTLATCGTCLSVNPPSASVDKKFVVIVAGKMLTTVTPQQVRGSNTNKGTLSNYLESPNSAGATPFAQGVTSAIFNDTVVFQ